MGPTYTFEASAVGVGAFVVDAQLIFLTLKYEDTSQRIQNLLFLTGIWTRRRRPFLPVAPTALT